MPKYSHPLVNSYPLCSIVKGSSRKQRSSTPSLVPTPGSLPLIGLGKLSFLGPHRPVALPPPPEPFTVQGLPRPKKPPLTVWNCDSLSSMVSCPEPHSREGCVYPPFLDWLSRMRKAPPGFPGNKSSSSAFSRLRPSYSHLEEQRGTGQACGS